MGSGRYYMMTSFVAALKAYKVVLALLFLDAGSSLNWGPLRGVPSFQETVLFSGGSGLQQTETPPKSWQKQHNHNHNHNHDHDHDHDHIKVATRLRRIIMSEPHVRKLNPRS